MDKRVRRICGRLVGGFSGFVVGEDGGEKGVVGSLVGGKGNQGGGSSIAGGEGGLDSGGEGDLGAVLCGDLCGGEGDLAGGL